MLRPACLAVALYVILIIEVRIARIDALEHHPLNNSDACEVVECLATWTRGCGTLGTCSANRSHGKANWPSFTSSTYDPWLAEIQPSLHFHLILFELHMHRTLSTSSHDRGPWPNPSPGCSTSTVLWRLHSSLPHWHLTDLAISVSLPKATLYLLEAKYQRNGMTAA